MRCGCGDFALSPLSSSFPTVGRQPPFSRRNPGQQRGTGWPPDKGATSGSPSSQHLGEAGDKAGKLGGGGPQTKNVPWTRCPFVFCGKPKLEASPSRVCLSVAPKSPRPSRGERPVAAGPGAGDRSHLNQSWWPADDTPDSEGTGV